MRYSNSSSQKPWKMIYSLGLVCLFEDLRISIFLRFFLHFQLLIISQLGSIPQISLLNLLGSYPDHQFQSLFVMEMDDASGYFGLKIELFTKNSGNNRWKPTVTGLFWCYIQGNIPNTSRKQQNRHLGTV